MTASEPSYFNNKPKTFKQKTASTIAWIIVGAIAALLFL